MRLILVMLGVVLLPSCDGQRRVTAVDNGPLAVVIKLNSAETFNNREEAGKYIDVQSVYDPKKYGEKISKEARSAEELYEEYLKFLGSFRKDRKFSSEFPYFKFDISETISGDKAEVTFVPKDKEEQLLRYQLARVDGRWIVKDIKRGTK